MDMNTEMIEGCMNIVDEKSYGKSQRRCRPDLRRYGTMVLELPVDRGSGTWEGCCREQQKGRQGS